jgi:hypothetical protein
MNPISSETLQVVETGAERKSFSLSKWEYAIPASAAVSLIISCIIISAKKHFWLDELFSYYLVGDHSFRHMMMAFADKFTNVPPLYFILGWLWAWAFGVTELSLRLFSSLGMSIACVITWITLRRNYQFWPTVIGTLGAFCLPDLVLTQNVEARMYGLFLAVCSVGVLEFDVINRRKQCSTGTVLINALIHVAIVQTHLFGIIYSGAILGAFVIRDRLFNGFRPRVYLSVLFSWLSLIPYIPTFLNQADAGNPRAWIPVPDVNQLTFVLVPFVSPLLRLVMLVVLVISAIRLVFWTITSRGKHEEASAAEVSLRILAFLFLAVPLCAWIVSHTIKPLFLPRYFIPTILAWAILLAYVLSRLFERAKSQLSGPFGRKLAPVSLGALTIILLSHPVTRAWGRPNESFPGGNDPSYAYGNLPIVASLWDDFMKRFHYSSERTRYFFVLDWEAALDPRSGLSSPQEYKTMDALKRDYPNVFGDHIVQLADFLDQHERFLVLADIPSDLHCPLWLEIRILNNPTYKTRLLGIVDGRPLLLVQKVK